LASQKHQTEDELHALRERNREELEEIDRLTVANEVKNNEGSDLASHIRTLEFEISKALNKVEELNRAIDQKTFDLKGKEQQLDDADKEIHGLKIQMSNFMNELNHLKGLEQRYKDENGDLQRRIDNEGCQNVELSGAIKELDAKIRQKEDQIMYMRKELEGARYSNNALIENNSALQVEIDSMNSHIRVVSHQNDELTREID
jgi:chromosome segregation ATPase